MSDLEQIVQFPAPGNRHIKFCGDVVVFRLSVTPAKDGKAFVRTNIGHADTMRREIIRQVERNEPRLGRDWFDLPMRAVGPGKFERAIGLHEVGHFEAKCLFLPEGGSGEPHWPQGQNTVINVEPAGTCSGNVIYNAFVRQFGPNKDRQEPLSHPLVDTIGDLDRAGYAVIPPSGTFRDLIGELDFIIHRLGCRWLQLLPIHPTPTTYGRMGRFGSPYAALSFTEVDPALAVFDPKATPLEQFLELVDAVHARGAKLLIDVAINHTGWAARLHESHPQWLARNDQGEIQNPGAWGVVWEDLTRLDYGHKDLWRYMADVLLTWCRRGVDGFRCDAGYMIPVAAWQYMIAKVRDQYPETVFFLEGLGGRISVTRDLLNRANFNWAYSELFQNYDRTQIEHYLPEAIDMSTADGITVHFAETHDNDRLAATSHTYAQLRTKLCALLSPNGAFAFANGVEWFATEKINVHDAPSLNWGADDNQTNAIAALTALLKTHPVFGPNTQLTMVSRGSGNFIALLRHHRPSGVNVLIVANLDWQHPVTASWDPAGIDWPPQGPMDLLSGIRMAIKRGDSHHSVDLMPGQVLCLQKDPFTAGQRQSPSVAQNALDRQRLQSKAVEVMSFFGASIPEDLSTATASLADHPENFCSALNPESDEPRVIAWNYPEDLKRQVMLPPGYLLLLRSIHPFRVRLQVNHRTIAAEESLVDHHHGSFALVRPKWSDGTPGHATLHLHQYAPDGTQHAEAEIVLLGRGDRATIQTRFTRQDCYAKPLLALDTNGRGAMMRVHSDWRKLASRYDALLAANLDPEVPEDRRILLARCRAWIVFQGYSHEINLDSLEGFSFDYGGGAYWGYQIPTGQGEHIDLTIALHMPNDPPNLVCMDIYRLASQPNAAELKDRLAVQLIIRPDIEDRNFHDTTKAYTGPEQQWPEAVTPVPHGFRFAPPGGTEMVIQANRGRFVVQPEWHYMVHRPVEAGRGLDADSDLFSPGYFSIDLYGGRALRLTAQAVSDTAPPLTPADPLGLPKVKEAIPLASAMAQALDHYLVKRGHQRSVIAGYPWFLDWGRDTLIVARGLVAAGKVDAVRDIIMQFARFESNGTLPNMIRGDDAANRDTSDAPLWLFTVCADLHQRTGKMDFLDDSCDGRTVRQVLIDMAASLIGGLPNGVGMDPDSGLIFSPAHFTWMDTNYPAGTPRQGYPVEIQALWYSALTFLAQIDPKDHSRWRDLAHRVKDRLVHLFWDPQRGHLTDCLHSSPGQGAANATPDDALRPNQLLAITLGAITDDALKRSILRSCQTLLVPGAIRSLADRPVNTPMPIYHGGELLNDPRRPYRGTYQGNEDTRRKPAYHNGTAWTWMFPSFCEAWIMTYGESARASARAWLTSSIELIDSHCVGHLPEIVDGDAPHRQRGCDAQAWGVSELLRVWRLASDLD